jgi:anti-sigma B factor antagonist
MAFAMQTRHVDEFTVLALSGRLTIGNAAESLHTSVEKAVDAGNRNIVLDMRDLDYVDSSGLGAIVTSLTCTRNRGGTLRLANLPRRIQALLEVSSLYNVFQIIELPAAAAADAGKANS